MSTITTSDLTIDKLISVLDSTIKRDSINKTIVFLAMLLAQTEDSQINVILSQQSSTGKTYIILECSKYFPESEIITFSNASPKALIHENGKLCYKVKGKWVEVNLEKKEKPKSKTYMVLDYENKILIFLDQPTPQLLEGMRSFLSHDKKDSFFAITDRATNGKMRTKTVVLRGHCSVFCAMVSPSMDMQETTRAFVLSPESDPEKNQAALSLTIQRESNPDSFRQRINNDPDRLALIDHVKRVRASGIKEIIIPEEAEEYLKAVLPSINPRCSRDAKKILSLVKGYALLNFENRERVNDTTIKATIQDVELVYEHIKPILESNALGVRPEIFDVYNSILKNSEPLQINHIQAKYHQVFGRFIGTSDLKKYLEVLENSGLITREKSSTDSRNWVYYGIRGD